MPEICIDGTMLVCSSCGARAAVLGGAERLLADRTQWPTVPCPVTPDCLGRLEPGPLL